MDDVLNLDIHEVKVRWTYEDKKNKNIRVDNIAKYSVLWRKLTEDHKELQAYPKFDKYMNLIGTQIKIKG